MCVTAVNPDPSIFLSGPDPWIRNPGLLVLIRPDLDTTWTFLWPLKFFCYVK
jgi:hypothetical protein